MSSTARTTPDGSAAPAPGLFATAPSRPRPAGLPLVVAAFRQRRRGLVFWSLGLAAVVLMYAPLYPSLEGSLEEQIASLPDGLAQAFGMTSMDAPGYVQSTVFGLLGAVLVLLFSVTAGARAVAGEEDKGLLDLYLTHGVSRRRLLAERALHLLLELLVLAGVVVLVLLAVTPGAGLGFGVDEVLAAGLGLLGIGVLTGAVALAVGAATGSRGAALGAAAVVGVGGYLANVLSDIAEVPWLKNVSPFHWAYGFEPLRNGFDGAWTLCLLYLVAGAAYGLGALALNRRDIGV